MIIRFFSVAISVFLLGCDGNSSGGLDPLSQPSSELMPPDSVGETNADSNPAQPASNDQTTNNTGDEIGSEGAPSENPEITNGQVSISLITATNTPGIGVPGSKLQFIQHVDHATNGYIALSGQYILNETTKHAVWSGLHHDISPAIITGDRIGGLPDNVRFNSASDLSVANDGSVALIAAISGAGSGSAALYSTPEGAFESIFREGDTALQLSNTTAEFSSFRGIQNSPAGQLIHAYVDSQIVLYFRDDNEIHAVASHNPNTLRVQPTTTTSCPISGTINGNFADSFLTDDGSIVFLARLNRSSDGQAPADCPRYGIIRYKNGIYTNIITTNSTLPGTSTADVTDLRLLGVLPSAEVLFEVITDTPTGEYSSDTSRSVWLAEPDSIPRLIGLGGESLPPDHSSFLDKHLSSTTTTIAFNNQVAMRTEAGRGATLLSGKPHVTQPYPDLSNPGAMALDFVASSNSETVPGYSSNSYFSQIGWPTIDQSGSTLFWAEVSDAENQTEIAEGIWRYSPETGLELAIASGTTFSFNSETLTLSGAIDFDNPNIQVESSGNFVFTASLENGGKGLFYATVANR